MKQTFASKNTQVERSIERIGSESGHLKEPCYSNIAQRIFLIWPQIQGGNLLGYKAHKDGNLSALLTNLSQHLEQCLAQSKALFNIY